MDILLDDNHDIELLFQERDFGLTKTESESLKQRLLIKLLTYQGEWFLDKSEGVPYYQSILGKRRAKESIDMIFKNKILSTRGVVSLESFSSNIDQTTREYRMSFRVVSDNKKEVVSVELTI